MRDLEATEHALADVVQRLLGGRSGSIAQQDSRLVGHAAFRLGIGPLLGWWLERGMLEAPPHVAAELSLQLVHARSRYLRLAGAAARIVAELRTLGIEPVLLKGLSCASRYPEAGTRPFQDIDLLVAPGQLAAAEAALLRDGFEPGARGAQRQDWMAPGFTIQSLDFVHSASGWGVDLHYGLERSFHRVLRAAVPVPPLEECPLLEVAGTGVRVLPPAHAIAVLAINASSSLRRFQLTRLLDIVYAARHTDAAGWRELVVLARRSGCGHFAYPALEMASRFSPGSIPAHVLECFRALVPARLVKAAFRIPFTGFGRADGWRPRYLLLWARSAREGASVLLRQLAAH